MRRLWVERRINGRENAVYWSAPDTLPAGFQGFNVRRSPQPCDDLASPSLELLTPSPVGVPFFVDSQPATEPFGVPSYIVTTVATAGEELIDDPVQVDDKTDADRYGRRHPIISMPRVFAEMRRRKNVLLGLKSETVVVLVRRLAGRRCPLCFKGEYEGSAKANCGTCYGTGWERGYEAVHDVSCDIGSITEALKLQPPKLVLSSNPKGWLVGFPLLRNGDAIVRADGKRYEVQAVSLAMSQGILRGQDFDLIAYNPQNPIHNVPV